MPVFDLDNGVDGGNNGNATSSYSFPFTVNGPDPLLTIHFAGDVVGGVDDVLSVLYAGIACALGAKNTDNSGDRCVYQYLLANPPIGTANVVITCGSIHFILAGAVAYKNTKALQPGASTAAIGDPTSVSLFLTPTASGSWGVVTEANYSAGTAPLSLILARRAYDTSYGTWGAFDTDGPMLTGGPTTMSVARGGGSAHNCLAVGVEYLLVGAGGGGPAASYPGHESPFG